MKVQLLQLLWVLRQRCGEEQLLQGHLRWGQTETTNELKLQRRNFDLIISNFQAQDQTNCGLIITQHQWLQTHVNRHRGQTHLAAVTQAGSDRPKIDEASAPLPVLYVALTTTESHAWCMLSIMRSASSMICVRGGRCRGILNTADINILHSPET